ncbi:hypothetical protein [Falsiporphyromonas endometrii]|uniref:ATP synthase F0 subunit 8 n=1 Tax=Falsiporphyromonas endometrii TaxID=1387297 RepID=A0ABV9K527_9PORP
MEISILLTILLIMILLGGSLLLGRKICLILEEQIETSSTNKYDLKNNLFDWVVKLIFRDTYLLNTVILTNTQKTDQTALIQPQNLKFEG